jgi:hypothetical protein
MLDEARYSSLTEMAEAERLDRRLYAEQAVNG